MSTPDAPDVPDVPDGTPQPAPGPGAPSRSGRRRVFAVALGVAAAFLVLEIVLRVLGPAAPVTKRLLFNFDDSTVVYHCYATNPRGTFSPLPDMARGRWRAVKLLDPPVPIAIEDIAATPWCIEYRKTSTGVRGPAIQVLPAPGVLRIAGIGDSFAQGDGVPHEQTLFRHMAGLLGEGYEVLNLGQSGADVDLNLRTLEWTVPTYRPARAIVVFTPNDVLPSGDLGKEEQLVFDLVNLREEALAADGRSWLRDASRTVDLLAAWRDRARITEGTIEGYLARYDPVRNGEKLALFDQQLQRLAHEPVPVALVLYPFLIDLDDYPLAPIHAYVAERARAAGLPVFDLAPVFAEKDAADLHVHPTDHHPNGHAHALAAEAVVNWLKAERPEFLRRR